MHIEPVTGHLALSIGDVSIPGRTRVNLGDDHPSRPGVVTIDLDVADSIITAARIQPGYVHRGVEKLFEVRSWRQVLSLADRHDWHESFIGELVLAMSIEKLMGILVPERAQWIRLILGELGISQARIAYLSFAVEHIKQRRRLLETPYYSNNQSSPKWDEYGTTLAGQLLQVRESIHNVFWLLTGNRVHPMFCRIGGVAADLNAAVQDAVIDAASQLDTIGAQFTELLNQTPIAALFSGRGVLTEDKIRAWGLSGVIARSSGLAYDLRRNPGYLTYLELFSQADIEPSTPALGEGDCLARFRQWASELGESAALVRAGLDGLSNSPANFATTLPKIVKVPRSSSYVEIESALGTAGVFVSSRGGTTPWRVGLRNASFVNLQAAERLLVGEHVDDVGLVVASLGYTVGDVDK